MERPTPAAAFEHLISAKDGYGYLLFDLRSDEEIQQQGRLPNSKRPTLPYTIASFLDATGVPQRFIFEFVLSLRFSFIQARRSEASFCFFLRSA
jgi:hypothetical protein